MNTEETTQERQDYLFLVTDNLIRQRQIWADDAGLQGLPIGGSLWMAAEQAVAAFKTGSLPASCRGLSDAVALFTRHWEEHTARAEVDPKDDPLPGGNVWGALDAVAEARKGSDPQGIRKIEPVADLVQQGVTDEQIAKIYKWKTDLGHWDIQKVREAKASPGKYDGEAYYEAKRLELEKKKVREREEALSMANQIAGKKPTTLKAGPESIETLAAQGLLAPQIARVKAVEVEDVLTYCREHGIVLDGMAPVPKDAPATEAAPASNREPSPEPVEQPEYEDDAIDSRLDDEEFAPPEGNPLSIEDQVFNAIDNDPGAKPGEIAKMLRLTPQKVTAILKRREEIEQVL